MQSVVLLVDDDRLIHKLFEAKFKERTQSGSLRLIHAFDGAEGLEKLAQNPDVSLILTDFQMPVMTGLEMLYHLKEQAVEIPTIVISSFDSMANLRSAMNAGAVDFAPKPVDFDDLFVSIDRTLEAAAKQLATQKARVLAEGLGPHPRGAVPDFSPKPQIPVQQQGRARAAGERGARVPGDDPLGSDRHRPPSMA